MSDIKVNINYNDLSAKIRVDEIIKVKNLYAIKGVVEDGAVYLGDLLVIKSGKKVFITYVNLILLYNMHPVNVAVKGEEIIIPISPSMPEVDIDEASVGAIREYLPEIANLGFLDTVIKKKQSLTESFIRESFDRIEVMKLTESAIQEGIFDDLVNKGLKVLLAPVKGTGKFVWNNKKGITISVALGIIAKKLWDKFTDPCKRPFRSKEEKLRCLQQAAEKVANELRKEQNTCLQLADPVQKRKCLWKVEKMRREWTQKSAQLKAEIYGK